MTMVAPARRLQMRPRERERSRTVPRRRSRLTAPPVADWGGRRRRETAAAASSSFGAATNARGPGGHSRGGGKGERGRRGRGGPATTAQPPRAATRTRRARQLNRYSLAHPRDPLIRPAPAPARRRGGVAACPRPPARPSGDRRVGRSCLVCLREGGGSGAVVLVLGRASGRAGVAAGCWETRFAPTPSAVAATSAAPCSSLVLALRFGGCRAPLHLLRSLCGPLFPPAPFLPATPDHPACIPDSCTLQQFGLVPLLPGSTLTRPACLFPPLLLALAVPELSPWPSRLGRRCRLPAR